MQALAQIAKTLATTKTAAVKVVKSAPIAVKTKPVAVSTGIQFGIHNGSRPSAGRALFALTHAWLVLSGMAAGKAFPRSQAIKVAGATAVNYHTGNGNFVCSEGMLTLSAKGQEKFGGERAARLGASDETAKMVDEWMSVLRTGVPSQIVGPKGKDHFFRIG